MTSLRGSTASSSSIYKRRKKKKKKEESISYSKKERRNISNLDASVESFISTSSESDMTESALSHIVKFMENRPLGQTSLKQFGIGVNGKAPFYPTIKRIDDDEKEVNGFGF